MDASDSATDLSLSSDPRFTWSHPFSFPTPPIAHSEPLIFGPLELDDHFESASPMGWNSTDDLLPLPNSTFLGDMGHQSATEWFSPPMDIQFEHGFSLKNEEPMFSWSPWSNPAFSSSEDITTSPSAESATLPSGSESVSSSIQPTEIPALPRMLSLDSSLFALGGSAPQTERSLSFGQDLGVHPSAISLPSSPWTSHVSERQFPTNSLLSPQPVRSTLLQQQPLYRIGPQASTSPVHFVHQTAHYTASASTPARLDSKLQPAIDTPTRKRKRPEGTARQEGKEVSDASEEREKIPQKSELHPPKQAPSTWQVFFTDWLQQHRTRKPADKLNVAQAAKEAGATYKSLSAEEKEALKRRAQVAKEGRERRLAAWQRTLTPEDIKRENRFRAAQRKAGKSRKGNIKDPNAPKKPLSAYFMFLAKIRSSPELVREVFGDEQETTKQSVLAAKRWREMSDAQKKPFLSQAEQDKLAYEAARKVYEGHTSGYLHGSSHSAFPTSTTILMTSFTTDGGTDNDGESEYPADNEEDWEDTS